MKKIYSYLTMGILLVAGHSQAQTQTFSFTGSVQSFTIPSCVSSVTITAHGAKGSNGNASTSPAGIGGNGAIVTGTYAVTPGDILNVYVGGQGTLTTGGFNGGGVNAANSSAGGGGASDVRLNGNALSNRIIVAGGGGAGGNGGCFGNTISGGNGGPGGGNGVAGTNSSAGGGGFPGVGTFFGSFGVGCGPFQGQSGSNGSGGVGGAGGLGTSLCSTAPTSGGSGGGGFIGGGGAGAGAAGTVGCQFNDTGAGGGGAGGDCYTDPAMTNTTINVGGAAPGNGLITITYTVNNPSILQTQGDERCETGGVSLTASASLGTADWYDLPSGGTLLFSGANYNPTVSATTIFYVEDNAGGGCVSSPRVAVTATVNNNVTGPSETIASCGTYTWNGTPYAASGTYTEVLTSAAGCDSTITLNLTVDNVDLGITQLSNTQLGADQAGASYQWINCATLAPIAGATNQTFTPSQGGQYACVVTNGACSDTTSCIDLQFAGLTPNDLDNSSISVYPNPTNRFISVDLTDVDATAVRVLNNVGQEVYITTNFDEQMTIDLKNNAAGIYSLQIETSKGTIQRKVVLQ